MSRSRKLRYIKWRARQNRRVQDGLVLCENCDTPASLSLSLALSWTACAICALGEADAFDDKDLIYVGSMKGKTK